MLSGDPPQKKVVWIHKHVEIGHPKFWVGGILVLSLFIIYVKGSQVF